MSVRIEGTRLECAASVQALLIVAQNPREYGINPRELRRQGNEINFTARQVAQILNPDTPERREVNLRDMDIRVHQAHAALSEWNFVSLAREFARRFPNQIRNQGLSFASVLFAPEPAACLSEERVQSLARRFLEQASNPASLVP
jgi:hypothetical protein